MSVNIRDDTIFPEQYIPQVSLFAIRFELTPSITVGQKLEYDECCESKRVVSDCIRVIPFHVVSLQRKRARFDSSNTSTRAARVRESGVLDLYYEQ